MNASVMNTSMSAFELRRWAMQCEVQAKHPNASGDEQDRLLKMHQALLTLAENQDWLDGKRGSAGLPRAHEAA